MSTLSRLVSFPEHYPPECPPADAANAAGVIYRFVKNQPPTAADFVPTPSDDNSLLCQSCGLSIMIDESGVKEAKEACPWFRKRYLAKARVNAEWGKIAKTSSAKMQNHHTWWVPTGKAPETIFDVVNVQ